MALYKHLQQAFFTARLFATLAAHEARNASTRSAWPGNSKPLSVSSINSGQALSTVEGLREVVQTVSD